MKRRIIAIISFLFVIIGVIVTVVIVNGKDSNEKPELYVYSFDKKVKLSFGYQDVYDMNEDEEKSSVSFKCNNIEEVKEAISDFEGHKDVNGNDLLYYDGYYFSYGYYENIVFFNNVVDEVQGVYFIPHMLENNNLFEISGERFENKDYLEFKDYIYTEYEWSVLDESSPFTINTKEKMIEYIESLNDRVAYYSAEDECIYINAYQFRSWAAGDRATSDYPYIIKLTESGFGAGFRNNYK